MLKAYFQSKINMVWNDAHGGNPRLIIIINHTVTYRLKQSLVSTLVDMVVIGLQKMMILFHSA